MIVVDQISNPKLVILENLIGCGSTLYDKKKTADLDFQIFGLSGF